MSDVLVGRTYRHEKSGRLYSVLSEARREADGVRVVVYGNVDAMGVRYTWVRPYTEFVAKFTLVDEQEMSYWINTASGKRMNLFDPRPEMIDLTDIALGLLQPRYAAQTSVRDRIYVLHHSMAVADVLENAELPARIVLAGLLHDASEAYICDLPAPMKRNPAMQCYNVVEDRLMSVVAGCFGFDYPLNVAVHLADHDVYLAEVAMLCARQPTHADWKTRGEPSKNATDAVEKWYYRYAATDVVLFFTQRVLSMEAQNAADRIRGH